MSSGVSHPYCTGLGVHADCRCGPAAAINLAACSQAANAVLRRSASEVAQEDEAGQTITRLRRLGDSGNVNTTDSLDNQKVVLGCAMGEASSADANATGTSCAREVEGADIAFSSARRGVQDSGPTSM